MNMNTDAQLFFFLRLRDFSLFPSLNGFNKIITLFLQSYNFLWLVVSVSLSTFSKLKETFAWNNYHFGANVLRDCKKS